MAGHIASSSNVDWNTDQSILEPTRKFFGGRIDLDPCSNDGSVVWAAVEYKLPTNDGLVDPWFGVEFQVEDSDPEGFAVKTTFTANAFVNPPFGTCYMHLETKDILVPKQLKALCDNLCVDPKKPTGAEKKAIRDLRAQYKRTSIGDWLRRGEREYLLHGFESIFLVPVQRGTKAWQEHVLLSAAAVCDLRGRPRFLGAEAGAPMDCCLVYWGDRILEFKETFSHLGRCQAVDRDVVYVVADDERAESVYGGFYVGGKLVYEGHNHDLDLIPDVAGRNVEIVEAKEGVYSLGVHSLLPHAGVSLPERLEDVILPDGSLLGHRKSKAT